VIICILYIQLSLK